jgi:hypothetical protein
VQDQDPAPPGGADGPGATRGDGGHGGEAAAWAGHLLPCPAVPAQDQGPEADSAGVGADGPGTAGRRGKRGLTPLTNIAVLHRFASALAIPPHLFGLATGAPRHSHPVSVPGTLSRSLASTTVAGERGREDGENAVRRRQLLSAARAVRDELDLHGLPLTRDTLAGRLRQARHPVPNARLTALLHALRSEAASLSLNGRR